MEEGTIFNGSVALPGDPKASGQAQGAGLPPTPPNNFGSSTKSPPALVSTPPPVPTDHGESFFSKIFSRKIIIIALVLFAIVTVLLLILTFLRPSGEKANTGNVALTYWGLWEDESVMRPIISEFERENPRIKVNYSKQDPKDYRERLEARIQNGKGPDIFRFHNSWYPMLSGILLPLPQETIGKNEFLNNYYDVVASDLIKNGAIYGIPLEIDTLALYVNQQIFDDVSREQNENIPVPATWQEFIESSQKLTKRDENGKISISGAAIGTFENISHAPDIISLLFAQNGVDFNSFEESGDKVSDALRFYTNFALVEDNVWDLTMDNSTLSFSQGKLAMFFGYSWDYFTIKSLNPNLNFKVVPVPQLVTDNKVNMTSYWVEGVSARSVNQKEALLFMKFLAKKETQEKLFTEQSKTRLFGEPYSRKDLAEKLKGSEAFVFADQAKNAVSSPFIDDTQDNGLNDKLNTYLKDSVNAILNGGSEESSRGTLFQGYSQVLGQYGQSTNTKDASL